MKLANRRKDDPIIVNLKNTLCSECKDTLKCSNCQSVLCRRPNLDIVQPKLCVHLPHIEGRNILCPTCYKAELDELIKGK